MKTIPIVYAADENFAMPLGVSIHSLVRRFSPDYAIELYIIDGGITPKSRRKIQSIAQRADQQRKQNPTSADGGTPIAIHWIQPDMQAWFGRALQASPGFNETVFYRLAIPRLLPDAADRALFVDADILFKQDAAPIMQSVHEGRMVAAVEDYSFATWQRRYITQADACPALGVDPDAPYFNAGLLGINLAYWREHGVTEQALRFLEQFPDYAKFNDQDALNYTAAGNWEPLDEGWNFQPTCRDTLNRRGWSVQERFGMSFEALQARAKAVHFTGKKPWDQGFTNPERGFFEQELKDSGWFTWPDYLRWRAGWWYGVIERRLSAKLASRKPAGAAA